MQRMDDNKISFQKKGELPRRRLPARRAYFWGGMKLITRREFVTGLAALGAGTLNSRALPILRNSSQDARIDSEKPPGQYFETWTAQETGITWKHDNALSNIRYLPESMGPGVAIFDYDNDGWMDLYFVNSGPADFFQPAKPLRNALYHNNRDGTFTDVTEEAGVAGREFVCVGVRAR